MKETSLHIIGKEGRFQYREALNRGTSNQQYRGGSVVWGRKSPFGITYFSLY